MPDIAIFCATFGVPCNALVIATTKPTKVHTAKKVKPKSAKLNAAPVNAKSRGRKHETQWLHDDGSRTLFISMPPTKCNAPNQQQIQVETFHAEASKETTNFSLSSAPKQSSFGLPLRFGTKQMHDAASHNLRTHLLMYDDDTAFQLNVADTYHPSRLVIPVVEVSTDDALSLLAIIVKFFPVGGHSPTYTFEVDRPQPASKSLPVVAATIPMWLHGRMKTSARSTNVYLSARCTPRCANCPQKVEVIECDLPSA